MSEKPKKRSMADSPTGTITRPNLDELKSQQKEPPQPPVTLPEAEQDTTITGVMYLNLNREGQDGAKDNDDSPTKSATKG